MSRSWLSLVITLLLTTHLLPAQEPIPSTPSLRADPDFQCSVEPRLTPIPELWSAYPGELRAELIIKFNGLVADAKPVKSTYSPDQTESAMKVLKTWQFEPAMKNGHAVSVRMDVALTFSNTSANLKFEFPFLRGPPWLCSLANAVIRC